MQFHHFEARITMDLLPLGPQERTFCHSRNQSLTFLCHDALRTCRRDSCANKTVNTCVFSSTNISYLITFHWRAKSIRMRGQGGFDDRFGPTVLAIALLLAIIVNFILRITGTGGAKK